MERNRIIAAGASAGGHLALTAMAPYPPISGPPSESPGTNQRPYVVAWIPEQPDRMDLARHLSPITYVRKGLPPILVLHGDADPIVPYEQSVALAKALKNSGDDAELITVPGAKHGFTPIQMEQLWPRIFQRLKRRKIGS